MLGKISRIIRNPMNVLDSIVRMVSFRIFDHTNYRHFIVLSRSRTGSSLLISYLHSHPNVTAQGEIFARLDGRKAGVMLSNVFCKQPLYIQASGFKIFYYHPVDDDTREIWPLLVKAKDLHVIHLKRRNILRTLISRKIAELQDSWNVTDSEMPDRGHPKQITIEKDEVEDLVTQTRQWENDGDFMFRNHPFHTVYYEDMVNDLESTMRGVYNFLGLRYSPPKTFLVKQNPEPLRQLVRNYDDLESAFRGSDWHMFFEE